MLKVNEIMKALIWGILAILAFASFSSISSSIDKTFSQERLSHAFLEGSIPRDSYPVISIGPVNLTTVDNFSDCVELGHMLSPAESNFGFRPTSNLGEPCDDLEAVAKADDDEQIDLEFYGRFWHGTAALTKVLMPFMEISDLKVILAILNLLVLSSITLLVYQKDKALGLVLGVFFSLGTDFLFQFQSITHGLSTAVGLIFVLLTAFSVNSPRWVVWSTAATGGVAYAYFAQLFTPMLFLLLTVAVLATRLPKTKDQSSNLFLTGTGVAWLVGYGAMMLWRFADLAWRLGPLQALTEFFSSVETKFTFNPINLFGALYGHVAIQSSTNQLRIFGFALLMFALGVVAHDAIRRGFGFRSILGTGMVLPFSATVLWYLVMLGHNGHGFVANLTLGVLVYIIFVIRITVKTVPSEENPLVKETPKRWQSSKL